MAFALSGLPALAQDEDPVALVVAIRGTAEAIDDQGIARVLAIKSPVYRSDTIRTGSRGRIQVLFTDNTIISLGRASEMVVVEHVWDAGNKNGAMKTQVKEGVFRIMGGAIAKEAPQSFITVTPAATIGIRGSMFAGRVDGGRLTVVFEGGRGIDVANDAGAVSITRPGFGTSIPAMGVPPESPKRFSAQDLSDLNRDLALGEQESEDGAPQLEQEDEQDRDEGNQEPSGNETGEGAGDEGTQESGETGDETADAAGDETPDTGIAEAGDENPETGDTSGLDAADEKPPLSDDISLEVSGSGGIPGMTSSEVSGDPVISLPTNPALASGPVIAAVPVSSTLTEVTQTWQEPFSGSDTSQLPIVNPVSLTGFHMSTLADPDDFLNINNSYQYDTSMQAISSNGVVSEDPAAQGGTFKDLGFSMQPYNPLATYTNPQETPAFFTRTISLLGAPRSFSMEVFSDTKESSRSSASTARSPKDGPITIASWGRSGLYRRPSTDGISGYSGPALGFEDLNVPGISAYRYVHPGELAQPQGTGQDDILGTDEFMYRTLTLPCTNGGSLFFSPMSTRTTNVSPICAYSAPD